MISRAFLLSTAVVLLSPALCARAQTFSCSAHNAASVVALSADSKTDAASAGFALGTVPTDFRGGSCSSATPFFFAAPAHDGNYAVTLVLGGPAASVTTVRAQARRLMVNQLAVGAGRSRTVSFVVNVRTPHLGGDGEHVHLKPRELGGLDWAAALTLEFNGTQPSVRSIRIEPVHDVPTMYLAGDSTVVDQDKEPWAAWGQMLPAFFGPGIAIANEAESGETIRSFEVEMRFAKIFSTIRPGDYLLMQFAHNDQKPGKGFVSIEQYQDLLRKYIAQARAAGATPILVTSMARRKFDAAGRLVETLAGYPQAMRAVGAEQHVAVLDLNAMSITLFETMGVEGTLKAFVHYPANTFPGQTEELKDDTHFNSYGAFELARCIVQAMRQQRLPVARYLRSGIPPFNPAHPDPVADFHLPPSPMVDTTTPYGR